MIVVRVKVSRGIEPFSPMGIYSADTSQLPNGEICMDKSHLLPNNRFLGEKNGKTLWKTMEMTWGEKRTMQF